MTQAARRQGEPRAPLLLRWLSPQDYSAARRYRAPSRLYGRLSRWIGVPLTSLGLAPRQAVTLEVPGRRTGRPRRNPVLITTFDGAEYLVSLAGESEWVRNARAAGGRAVLHRRGARAVQLVELPPDSRAPVLAAYQAAGAARSGEAAARVQARFNFGLGPEPTLADFEPIADRYPVFGIDEMPREG
jgi:deazaflavin-dependent oxidoreductase (nitroreductase family)